MPVDIFINDVIGYIATRRPEIAACPKVSSPVGLAQLWKLFLNLTRSASRGELDEIGPSNMGRNRDEDVDMITGNHSVFDAHPHLFGNLGNDIPNPLLHGGSEHPIAVLGDPDKVIAVVVNRMTGAIILLHACYAIRIAGAVKLKFTHLKMGVLTILGTIKV